MILLLEERFHLHINLDGPTRTNISTLHIVDFFVIVNKILVDEEVIKNAFIQSFEIYARKLNIEEIKFSIWTDHKVREEEIYNEITDLPSNFSWEMGTASRIFEKNNFTCLLNPVTKRQITWEKTLS